VAPSLAPWALTGLFQGLFAGLRFSDPGLLLWSGQAARQLFAMRWLFGVWGPGPACAHPAARVDWGGLGAPEGGGGGDVMSVAVVVLLTL